MLKMIMVILFCLCLTACASLRGPQSLQQGKIDFAAGNYKPAFLELLPLASEGNAEAQYAVGYMYYYGYGVAQDNDSGIFWMQKAAQQHHVAAIKALSMLGEKSKK